MEYPLTYDGHDGVWAGSVRALDRHEVDQCLPDRVHAGHDGFGLEDIAAIPGSSSIWGVGSVGRSPSNHTQDSLIAVYGGTP